MTLQIRIADELNKPDFDGEVVLSLSEEEEVELAALFEHYELSREVPLFIGEYSLFDGLYIRVNVEHPSVTADGKTHAIFTFLTLE